MARAAKLDPETGAAARLVGDGDFGTVFAQNLADQIQAQSGAVIARLQAVKGLKDVVALILGDALALIGHLDAVIAADPDGDGPGLSGMLQRVLDQIDQHPPPRSGIAQKRQRRHLGGALQRAALLDRQRRHVGDHLAAERDQIDRRLIDPDQAKALDVQKLFSQRRDKARIEQIGQFKNTTVGSVRNTAMGAKDFTTHAGLRTAHSSGKLYQISALEKFEGASKVWEIMADDALLLSAPGGYVEINKTGIRIRGLKELIEGSSTDFNSGGPGEGSKCLP